MPTKNHPTIPMTSVYVVEREYEGKLFGEYGVIGVFRTVEHAKNCLQQEIDAFDNDSRKAYAWITQDWAGHENTPVLVEMELKLEGTDVVAHTRIMHYPLDVLHHDSDDGFKFTPANVKPAPAENGA